MHPSYCPEWEYANHPQRNDILPIEVKNLLFRLRTRHSNIPYWLLDTRPAHSDLFCQLTPDNFSYYAGNYRGDNQPCLQYCNVGIQGRPHVGYHPSIVSNAMDIIVSNINIGLDEFDLLFQSSNSSLTEDEKLVNLVVFACSIFIEFTKVHPYINGNGHIGRFILTAILGKYGYWLNNWSIDPRPFGFIYTHKIREYEAGNTRPLEEAVLMDLL